MDTIRIIDICGAEVLSRANVRKLYDFISDMTRAIDMNGVNFISRSVADELCNITNRFPDLALTGMSENVETMWKIVRRGRSMKREYGSKAKISMTVNCKTMEDLQRALLTHGGR